MSLKLGIKASVLLAIISFLFSSAVSAGESAASISVESTELMRKYAFLQLISHLFGIVWSATGLIFMLHFGISARLRDQVNTLTSNFAGRLAIYYACLSLSLMAFTLPVYVIGDYSLGLAFGQERQSFFVWVAGRLFDTVLDIALTVPVLSIVFFLINRFPRRWGLALLSVAVPLTIFRIVISPIALDFMNQGFHPLPDGALKTRLVALAQKCGIEKPVLVVEEAGAYSSEINAYVTGIGPVVRLVVYDTALDSLKDDEIEVMFAHEIGHYQMNHLWLRSVAGLVWVAVVLSILPPVAPMLVSRMPKRWGIKGPGDIAIIPAAWIACYSGNFLISPATHAFGRYMEYQADQYALEKTLNPDAMIRELATYAKLNVVDPSPSPAVVFFFHNHPPISERIEYINRWKSLNSAAD